MILRTIFDLTERRLSCNDGGDNIHYFQSWSHLPTDCGGGDDDGDDIHYLPTDCSGGDDDGDDIRYLPTDCGGGDDDIHHFPTDCGGNDIWSYLQLMLCGNTYN